MIASIDRLGGVLVAPKATFGRLIERDEGRLFGVLGWFFVWVVAVAPEPVGRGLLLLRSDAWAGATLVLSTAVDRLAVVVGVAIAGAVGLNLWSRRADRRLDLDRALDLSAHCLVPFLAVATAGSVLASLGLNLEASPHRPLRGDAGWVAVRAIVGFGPCAVPYAVLFALLGKKAGP